MSFGRKEFRDAVAEKARKRRAESLPAIQALQAAGVIMARLTTGSEEWNRYLSYLQGHIERTRARRDVAQTRQNDPTVWDIAERNKLKADILQAEAMIAALQWAMELPKALVDGGAQATEFLNKLDHENDQDTGQAQP